MHGAWLRCALAVPNAGGLTARVVPSQVLLASVLDATLEACAGEVACSCAQRAFEARFSRLVVRSAVRSGWEAGEDAMSAAVVRLAAHPVHSSALFADAAFARQPRRPSGARLRRCCRTRASPR